MLALKGSPIGSEGRVGAHAYSSTCHCKRSKAYLGHRPLHLRPPSRILIYDEVPLEGVVDAAANKNVTRDIAKIT